MERLKYNANALILSVFVDSVDYEMIGRFIVIELRIATVYAVLELIKLTQR